jgi:hypothetical protein
MVVGERRKSAGHIDTGVLSRQATCKNPKRKVRMRHKLHTLFLKSIAKTIAS